MQKLRVGLIGPGNIARNAHMPAFLKEQARVEVVAVASRTLERAQGFAQEFAIPQVFDSYEEMLRVAELDAVCICTPNKFHAPAAIAALRAGCHVLCEKPPAMTAKEAEEMAQAAEETGKILAFALNNRFRTEVQTLKRFVDAGELGEIYAVRVVAMRRRGIPGWGVFTNKELQGGGPLIDIGVHMIDAALHLMGYPEPELVLGSTYQKIGNRQGVGLSGQWDWQNYSVEDMARGMIRFQGGATMLFETSFAANIEPKEMMQVSLMGDRGGADLFPLKIYQEKHESLLDITPVFPPVTDVYGAQITRFVDGCLSGVEESPLCTARESVILQKILCAIYESAETNEPIRFS